MLHSPKSALMFPTKQAILVNTLNKPSSAWESFNVRQKLGLFVLEVTLTYSWIFAQFASNWYKWVDGSSTRTVYRYHLTHEISIFVKILFNFKKKNVSLNTVKENPSNVVKNQEIVLIISHHFKNLISSNPAWNINWSLILSRNLKR